MTWCVGLRTPFSYAVIGADIAVTVGSESVDCLQKVYPIAPFMCAAFSGSVRIGFQLLADLARFAAPPEVGMRVWPRMILHKWRREARRVFKDSEQTHKNLGAQLLVAGIDPQTRKSEPWPRAHVAILRAPEFLAVYAKPLVPASIGTGSHVTEYNSALHGYIRTQPQIFQFEAQMPFTTGKALLQFTGEAVAQQPREGISRHMHLCIVRRWDIDMTTNEYLHPNDVMPEVARTWPKLKARLRKLGFAAAETESACSRG